MKTIVITGASRGIGHATAEKFLGEGWRVFGTYHTTPISITAENFFAIKFDQGDSKSIQYIVEIIQKIAPRIDVLVNNAAVLLDAHTHGVDIEKIEKTFEVNLFGIIDLTERLLSTMTEGSHIVNVDSAYGAFSVPIDDTGSVGYRLAKAALNMYTRTLAFRMNDSGIIVSALDPGWVDTDMGNIGVMNGEKPDRNIEEAAEDIFALVHTVTQSGQFWRFGKKREW